MAITVAKNPTRVWTKMLGCIHGGPSTSAIANPRGANTVGRIKQTLWVNAGAPSGAAPTGMSEKDLILDTTNSTVYRYITGTTYVHMTAIT